MKNIKLIAIFLISMIFSLGCGGKDDTDTSDSQTKKFKVVATTGMIADAAKNVGGNLVEVIGLMGPGVDPHLYKASEGDVTRMFNADLILFNGLHLEGAMAEVLEKMGERANTYAVSSAIKKTLLLSPAEFEGAHDPHIWFDVAMWNQVTRGIRDKLIELDSQNTDAYIANADIYIRQLDSLHNYVKQQAGTIPIEKRVIITAHDAFNYFGNAYGFEVRGLQGISTASEAGTADVQNLAKFIALNKVPALFVESSVPVKNIQAVQAAVKSRGFEVKIGGELFSDAMGSPDTPEGNYIGMVRHNIDTIVKALATQ